MLFHKHVQHIVTMIPEPNMNKLPHSTPRYHNKSSKFMKLAIITQIWDRAKFYFTCISGPWYLIMVPNMKKIHPAIMEECVRMN